MPIPKTLSQVKTLSEKSPAYLKSDLLPLDWSGEFTSTVKDYLKRCRELIHQRMDEKVLPSRVVHLQSLLMDQLITGLYRRGFEESQARGVPTVPLALFALGGYGRGELNLFSDLDLLFLYEGRSPKAIEPISKNMLYPLWDAKEEVGYSIRNIHDCGRVMAQDIRAMSSMLDARYLAGDRELALKFFRFLESRTSSSRALKKFIQAKSRENEARLKRFGGSVYVIEPNIKESEGGLRDWHTLRYFVKWALKTPQMDEWVRRGVITNEEAEKIRRALEFFWGVRNRLHRLAGRNQDQLFFQFQEPIATDLGFETDGVSLGVEKFMQAYYAHAADILRLRIEVTRRLLRPPRSLLRRLKNRLRPSLSSYFFVIDQKILPKSFAQIGKHPVEIMRAFWFAQKKGLILHEDFKAYISQHLHLIDQVYREHPEVCRLFREMVEDVAGIGNTLAEMHDCRFLGVFIPEFGDVLYQTQHDVYHVYTVDTHSIKAVQELSKLKQGNYDEEFPAFKQAIDEVQKTAVLVLGVWFHDIGKGKGGRHSEVGARLAQQIMTRLGYEPEERDLVEFLVLSHLIMPHLSQRRDLEDVNLINHFGKTMESVERLRLLFVLTWADIRAVGPDVWTPWKGALLRELYEKTRQVLEAGDFNTERAVVVMEDAKKVILKEAPKRFDKRALQEFIDVMPPRYFLANEPEKILEHFEIVSQSSEDEEFVFSQSPDYRAKYNEVLIYAVNSPRLFEHVTGVMAAHQINILAFEQFFDTQGETLLLLRVTDQRANLIEEGRRFENIRRDLANSFLGKQSFEEYMKQKRRPGLLAKKAISTRPPRVEIDNDVSPYYTVIDIYAHDRLGLLYDLACVMRQLNLFIEVSKISTKVDQVADVFYVKDIFGHKIKEKKKVRAIQQEILAVLEQKPGES